MTDHFECLAKQKISKLGTRMLGCINRIVLPDNIKIKQKQKKWAKLQMLKMIKKYTSDNAFECLTHEKIQKSNYKQVRKVLRKVLEKNKPNKPRKKSRRNLRLGTINLNQLGDNKSKLRDAIALTNADILCIQESMLKRGKRKRRSI